jgi:PTH2 family peptidyl-tRNA hydrolase
MIKQVIIVRKDLNMRKGKLAAQVAHASMKVFIDRKYHIQPDQLTPEMLEWLNGNYAKIVVSVNSEVELLEIHELATKQGLPASLVIDEGRTEFGGQLTKTCVAIGPAYGVDIDEITGKLPLI